METLLTVAVILGMIALGALFIHRLNLRQGGGAAAMRRAAPAPNAGDGAAEDGRLPGGPGMRLRFPRLRPRRDHRDGGRGRHPARRRRRHGSQ